MGRNLSLVGRKLSNLDSDAENRRIAINALKTYVKDLYSKAIMSQCLAQDHSPNLIPQSAGSFPLQQACSKVFSGIAIQPKDKKRFFIHSWCKMSFARGVTLQTATMLASEKVFTGLDFRRNLCYGRERSHLFASPESQTIDFFSEYGSLVDSPTSTGQVSCNFEYGGRQPVSRKLWRNENNGVVDVYSSYSEAGSGSNGSRQYFEGFEEGEVSDFGIENSEVFWWFRHAISSDRRRPQRTHCQLSYHAIKIYKRRLYLDGNGLSVIKDQSYKCYNFQESGYNENSGSERPTTTPHLLHPAYYPRVVAQNPQSRREQVDTDVGTEKKTWILIYRSVRDITRRMDDAEIFDGKEGTREKQSLNEGIRNVDIFPEVEIEWEDGAIPPAPAPLAFPIIIEIEVPIEAPAAAADYDEVASDVEEVASDDDDEDVDVASDVTSDDEEEWFYPPNKRMKKNGD